MKMDVFGLEAIGDISLERSVPARFEHIVSLQPNATALICGDVSMTYGDLNRAANRLAHAILKADLSTSIVALICQHSIEAIVAIMGVLKAGKTYVGINNHHPAERNSIILRQSEASLIVTQLALRPDIDALLDILRPTSDIPLLFLEEMDDKYPDYNPGLDIAPDTILNLQSTSGSTGTPKATFKTHAAVMKGIERELLSGEFVLGDRVPLLHPYSQGMARKPIFGSLLTGAVLCIYDLRKEGLANLANWLVKHEITSLAMVPSVFRQFVRTLPGKISVPKLRKLSLSGEAMTRRDVELFRQYFPPTVKLYNRFGSSETSLIAMYPISPQTEIRHNIIPVGFPARGVELLLLGENDNVVGPEEEGEIVIRSHHGFGGYWNDSSLTHSKYIVLPGRGDEPFIRTGDLGKIDHDGILHYLGRRDQQIKIRGLRVEPAEIEMVLLEQTPVQEAAVIDYEDQRGEKRLAAYLVASEANRPSVHELWSVLEAHLPEYMIPASYIYLDALPYTVSNKLDRNKLPAPQIEQNADYFDPRTPIEKHLAEIWKRLLSIERVGIRDRFFSLGGNSLLAVEFIARANDLVGGRLSLGDLAHRSTIEEIAELLERDPATRVPVRSLVTLQPQGDLPPLYLIHPRGGHIFHYYELVNHFGKSHPIFGLQAQGLQGGVEPHTRIEDMAAHYVREIREMQPDGPYYIAGWSMGSMIAFEMAHQLRAQGQRVGLVVSIDSYSTELRPYYRLTTWTASMWNSVRRYINTVRRAVPKEARAIRLMSLGEIPTYVWQRFRTLWYWQVVRRKKYANITQEIVRDPERTPERRVIFANNLAQSLYTRLPYDGRALVLSASRTRERHLDARPRWGALLQGDVQFAEISGDHASILQPPAVADVTRCIQEALTRAVELEAKEKI